MADDIEKLAEAFARFPGIGPRQSRRFVYFLLSQPKGFNADLAKRIANVQSGATTCQTCRRFFAAQGNMTACTICSSKNRDGDLLLVVEKDSDLESIERSNSYNGLYFVLGGAIPILEKEPHKRIRLNELKQVVQKRAQSGLREIILAFSVNPDGENTADVVTAELADTLKAHGIRVTKLGRGLSTGSELEYADSETLKSALKNRT